MNLFTLEKLFTGSVCSMLIIKLNRITLLGSIVTVSKPKRKSFNGMLGRHFFAVKYNKYKHLTRT